MDILVIHSLYIPYIYFLEMFHVFSLVCFLIYGVKSKSGHDWSQSFGPIWHVSGPEMVFWRNDIMILHHFCRRSSKIKLFWPKTLIFDKKSRKYLKNPEKYPKFLGIPRDLCGGPMSLRSVFRICFHVWMIFRQMINLFNKIDDFIKSEKTKRFPLVCSKYLSSWTGLGRSGHVRFQTVDPIWHVSGSKIVFWRNDIMILHHFCRRSSKIKLF